MCFLVKAMTDLQLFLASLYSLVWRYQTTNRLLLTISAPDLLQRLAAIGQVDFTDWCIYIITSHNCPVLSPITLPSCVHVTCIMCIFLSNLQSSLDLFVKMLLHILCCSEALGYCVCSSSFTAPSSMCLPISWLVSWNPIVISLISNKVRQPLRVYVPLVFALSFSSAVLR